MATTVEIRIRQLIGELVVQGQAAAARIEELEEKIKELEAAQLPKANGGDIKSGRATHVS